MSDVAIDASTGKATTRNAKVGGFTKAAGGAIRWNATENALPFPLMSVAGNGNDAPYNLAVASSDFVDALDQEMLKVSNLTNGRYRLTIDGKTAGEFTSAQLAQGINLAVLPTPMLEQARLVGRLTQIRADIHNSRWREFQVPLAGDPQAGQFIPALIKNLDAADGPLTKAQRDAAKPRAHAFELKPL